MSENNVPDNINETFESKVFTNFLNYVELTNQIFFDKKQ